MSDNKNICKIDIPFNEFKDIIFKNDKLSDIESSPFDYLVTESKYELTINNNIMEVNLNLKLSTFKNKFIKIKLLSNTAVVISTKVSDGSLGFDGEYYSFFSKKASDYNINIVYSIPIKKIGELRNIELATIMNSEIKLLLPLDDNYTISSCMGISEKIKNNEKVVDFYVKDRVVKIIWGNINNKKEEKTEQKILPPIIHSNSRTIIDITDSSVSYNSKVKCNIYQTPVNKLEFKITNAKIITITGSNIKDYDIKENNNENTALIYFEKEQDGEYEFDIYYEKELKLNEELIDISSLNIKNAERDEGYLVIVSKTVSDLEFINLNNIRVIDINEVPKSLKENLKIKEALKYLITPYNFELKLIKHKKVLMPISVIKNAIFTSVVLKKGIVLNSILLEIKNNDKPFIEMELNNNTIPLSSFIKGKPVKPIKSEDGKMMLSLPKFTSAKESFWIEIILLSTFENMKKTGEIKIILPVFDITISHLYWKLYLPEKFKYKNFKGNIEKLNYFKTEPPYYPYGYQEDDYDDYYEDDYDDYDEEDYDSFGEEIDEPEPVMASMMMEMAPSPKRTLSRGVKERKRAKKVAAPAPAPVPARAIVKKAVSGSFIQKQTGKIPVKINIPLVGSINYYEKLFVENESIKLNFNYKKLGKEEVKPL